MKCTAIVLLVIAVGVCAMALTGCSTTVTRTTMPDGTIVEVTAKTSDAVAIAAACEVANEVLPVLSHLATGQGGQANTTSPAVVP